MGKAATGFQTEHDFLLVQVINYTEQCLTRLRIIHRQTQTEQHIILKKAGGLFIAVIVQVFRHQPKISIRLSDTHKGVFKSAGERDKALINQLRIVIQCLPVAGNHFQLP